MELPLAPPRPRPPPPLHAAGAKRSGGGGVGSFRTADGVFPTSASGRGIASGGSERGRRAGCGVCVWVLRQCRARPRRGRAPRQPGGPRGVARMTEGAEAAAAR